MPPLATALVDALDPPAVLPGGELRIRGRDLVQGGRVPEVRIAGTPAALLAATPRLLVARVPDTAVSGPVEVAAGLAAAQAPALEVGVLIAEHLHPVCNPAVDAQGSIYATLSGARGQKTPVSIYRLDENFVLKSWSSAVMNPSGLAFDRSGSLFASSRHDGSVYRLSANGAAALVAEGLGVATGIAFDAAGDLYVGDRSGTVFKIDAQRNMFVFATLEPSVAAYHLAFGPDRELYVSGPSTSSYDTIWRVSPAGRVEPFFRGLGRPQGIAFDAAGSLYVVASYRGRRGVVRITAAGRAECVVSGNNLVGLAFAPRAGGGAHPAALILATHNSLYSLAWPVPGLPLPPAPAV
jgi:sugar lactone lactonase YvrE